MRSGGMRRTGGFPGRACARPRRTLGSALPRARTRACRRRAPDPCPRRSGSPRRHSRKQRSLRGTRGSRLNSWSPWLADTSRSGTARTRTGFAGARRSPRHTAPLRSPVRRTHPPGERRRPAPKTRRRKPCSRDMVHRSRSQSRARTCPPRSLRTPCCPREPCAFRRRTPCSLPRPWRSLHRRYTGSSRSYRVPRESARGTLWPRLRRGRTGSGNTANKRPRRRKTRSDRTLLCRDSRRRCRIDSGSWSAPDIASRNSGSSTCPPSTPGTETDPVWQWRAGPETTRARSARGSCVSGPARARRATAGFWFLGAALCGWLVGGRRERCRGAGWTLSMTALDGAPAGACGRDLNPREHPGDLLAPR
jgi:hypothetical protein